MKTMRGFVTDDRLHRALDEVEAIPMPYHHRQNAVCGMGINGKTKKFELWYIEEEPQSQASYCHELVHAVVWIDGGPTTYRIEPRSYETSLQFPPFNQSWQLVQHIPVWQLIKEMGFDESASYLPLMERLAQIISQNQLYLDASPERIIPCQAIALVHGLLRPSTPEVRDKVRKAALKIIPQALELADAIIFNLGKRTLFSVSECEASLNYLLDIIKIPREILQILSLDRVCENFRLRILAAAKL
jgi:hypothetical protein